MSKRLVATLLTICLLFGCMSMTALAQENETIAVGENKHLTVEAAGDEILEGGASYTFTPEESGAYFMTVEYLKTDASMYGVMFYVGDGEELFSFDEPLRFEAVAGESYVLTVEYFGLYSENVDYEVAVHKAQPLDGIELSAEKTNGKVGDYLYIDVTYLPEFGEREELTWTVSDENVAAFLESYSDYAELELLSAGAVTVTATTESGKSASVDITVEEIVFSELTEGMNPVTVTNDGQLFTFTAERSGYYSFDADHMDAGITLDAESVSDGTNVYYVLEEGETYQGEVYVWGEEEISFNVVIAYHDGLEFPIPTAIEISKLPDNITYLKNSVEEIWSDNMLSGMELKLTWADGSVTDWSFDENNGMIGIYSVCGYLNQKEDGGYEVEVYIWCDAEVESVFFDLNILDAVAESIELVDSTPLQIVENSCGMHIDILDGWLYFPFEAYHRQVKITFSDGSVVTAVAGDEIYGVTVECANNQGVAVMSTETQPEGFWAKDRENLVIYQYGDLSVQLEVEIIDSPVESIEIVTPPTNTIFMLDEDANLVTEDGAAVESISTLLEGITLKVTYKDGTQKTFTSSDFQWLDVMGDEYPYLDGYPVGVFGGWLMTMEPPTAPSEVEGYLEYKGVTVTYPIQIVEQFPSDDDDSDDKPVIEPIPETADYDMVMGLAMTACLMAAAVAVTTKKKHF